MNLLRRLRDAIAPRPFTSFAEFGGLAAVTERTASAVVAPEPSLEPSALVRPSAKLNRALRVVPVTGESVSRCIGSHKGLFYVPTDPPMQQFMVGLLAPPE